MEKINFLLVFIEGILSFVSPCVLPILPVYLTVLAGSGTVLSEENTQKTVKTKLFKNTLFFMLGISTTFFILGTSIQILNQLIFRNKQLILLVGGLLIILMGIFYMGYLKLPFLQKERKFHMQIKQMNMGAAYLLGLTFSFGWTPCVGPMLASVLILASSAKSTLIGNILIALYSLGFMVPFMLIALFYKRLFKFLDKLKIHMGSIQKIGGVLLITTGLIMVFGGSAKIRGDIKGLLGHISQRVQPKENQKEIPKQEAVTVAPDFTLVDQYGNTHTLSEYKGKTVFLNFWATWCPPCKAEMPHIQELYKEYGENKEEVVILGIAMPEWGKEGTKEDITEFLKKEGYTFPVVFDQTDQKNVALEQTISYQYYISAFPTTFIINKEGNIVLYVPGGLDKKTMQEIIEQANMPTR